MAAEALNSLHSSGLNGISGHKDQPVDVPPKKKNYHDVNVGGIFAHAAKACATQQ